MDSLEFAFWSCAACTVYTYALYPLALAIAARFWGRPVRLDRAAAVGPVSVVVAAYNEEATIGRRLEELCKRVADLAAGGEVIAVSDGSTDRTAEVARAQAGVRFASCGTVGTKTGGQGRLFDRGLRGRKARDRRFRRCPADLGPGRPRGTPGELRRPHCRGGQRRARPGDGARGHGRSWHLLEVRNLDASRGESPSFDGRPHRGHLRRAPRAVPADPAPNDPGRRLLAALRGDGGPPGRSSTARARAFDRLPERARDEFRRKVRTLGGNYQLVARLPSALLPWRNPVWLQFISHKLFRLLVPWALLGLLGTAALLDGTFYRVALAAQIAFYLLGLAGCWTAAGSRSRVASAAASFLMLNAAAWVAFWVWVTGRLERSWGKVAYKGGPPDSHSTEPADGRMGMTTNGPGITTAGKTNG